MYSRLSDAYKASADKVQAAMMKSFGVSKSAAYLQFTSRRLPPDEVVETYVADLNRLLCFLATRMVGTKIL